MSAKKSSAAAETTSSPVAIVPSTSSEGLHEGRNNELVGEVQIVSLLLNTIFLS
jgi:hypothetical protein